MTRRHDDGFTLVEVLVAFSIAALLLVPLMRGFSQGIGGATRSGGVTEATLIAESTLERVGSGVMPEDGVDEQTDQGVYRIHASVRRFADAAAETPLSPIAAPYEVEVTVSWPEATRTRSIALRSLRLGPPPGPQQ